MSDRFIADMTEAWQRAKKAGNNAALARNLGVTPQALAQWKIVPPSRVLGVERYTNVPRHELRPDYYPPPQPAE